MLLLNTFRVFHACMTTTIGFISLAFINTYTSPIEDEILKRGVFTIDTYPLFVSILNIGGLFGSLIAGPISEWLGIKTSLIIFSQLGTLGAMLLVLAHDGVSMIAARFIIGFYTAMCLSVIPLYNTEVAPESMKKLYGGMLSLAMGFGILTSYFFGIWLGYRWLAIIYMVMVVFMTLNLVFLPESPKWLRNKGWNIKADQACEYFYESSQANASLGTNETTSLSNHQLYFDNEIFIIGSEDTNLTQNKLLSDRTLSYSQSTCILPNINCSPNASLYEKISNYFVWPVMRPLLVCCSLQAFRISSGYLYLAAYSVHTLDNAVSINPKIAVLFYPTFLIIGGILALWVINIMDWKKLLMITTLVQILTNALLSLTLYLSIRVLECTSNQGTIFCNVLQLLPMPLIGLFGFTYSLGWGSIIWWFYNQLHPYYIRISGGICSFVLIMSNVINLVVAPLLVEYSEPYTLFLIYAVLCLLGLITQLLY